MFDLTQPVQISLIIWTIAIVLSVSIFFTVLIHFKGKKIKKEMGLKEGEPYPNK